MASANRLMTRNAISLVFSMPGYYKERIRAVDGVNAVTTSNWFGGIYKDQSTTNFFPQFAVDHDNFFDLYPEFKVDPAQLAAWKADRQGIMVGRLIADQHGFKIGDRLPIKGTIYPGTWDFVVRGIFEPKDNTTVTRQVYFHYDYLNEQMKKTAPRRADQVGIFVVQIADGSRAAEISQAIDNEFRNSLSETLTETEKAFQLGFVAQSEAIVVAIRIVSYVVILIILAVVANTMAMTARERIAEYATLKALGFGPGYVARLIFFESLALTLIGGGLGILLTFPVADAFKQAMGSMFPVFNVTPGTAVLQFACALAVGVLAALAPGYRASQVKIVDGLRHIG
jgi:putative ABC transport system permease protein